MRIDRVKFAAALARADLNVKQISEKSGISRGTVTSVKSGKSCREETAKRLADGLGVSVADILKKED